MTIDVFELDETRPWSEVDDDAHAALAWLDEDRPVDLDDERDRDEL